MRTVLFVNATIGFSENLFLVSIAVNCNVQRNLKGCLYFDWTMTILEVDPDCKIQ